MAYFQPDATNAAIAGDAATASAHSTTLGNAARSTPSARRPGNGEATLSNTARSAIDGASPPRKNGPSVVLRSRARSTPAS